MPTLETAPTTANLLLEQIRVIRAPRGRVYEAWTNPEIMKQWFGPAGRHCPGAEVDLRVGGAYRIEVMPDVPAAPQPGGSECESQLSVASGNYTKIVPNQLLQFTWTPSWNPEEQSLVTLSLRDVAEGTEISIRHERFLSEQSRDGHSQGWSGCMDKLVTLLQS